jgi:RHS repeat-associated protein
MVGTTPTYYLYADDSTVPVCELNASGTVTATNTVGVNGLISRHTPAGSTLYQFDPQGTVAARLDSTGAATSCSTADAFGVVSNTATVSDPFGYEAQAGYYTDQSTGLVLTTFRYYDPGTGRFINRDPIGYSGGINVYGYCGNGAEDQSDPIGTDDEDEILPASQSGGSDLVAPLTTGIHNLSGIGIKAGVVASSFDPEANIVEAQSGQDASGATVSIWDRILSAVAAVGPFASEVGGEIKGATELHHIFPQAQEFRANWERLGFNHHDFTVRIPKSSHILMHSGPGSGGDWNAAWRGFFATNETYNFKDVADFADELMHQHGVQGCPLINYSTKR